MIDVENNNGCEEVRERRVELCLIGRFLPDITIRFIPMQDRLATVWRPARGVEVREAKHGRYFFQFFHRMDMIRVLTGGSWSLDNFMLVLSPVSAGESPSDIPLNHLAFWVQIHDLPIGFMTQNVGRLLGHFIGEFVEYDTKNNEGIWRPYMRIKVKVDIRLPLKKDKKVKKAGEEWKVVQFKYERLEIFCFVCGMLGHTD